ncbi:sortase [Patescibacteria group bacterium]|nr:sortase [Patescibacteria group bacterium]
MTKKKTKLKVKSPKPQLRDKVIGYSFVFLSLLIILLPAFLKDYKKTNPIRVSPYFKEQNVKGLVPNRIMIPSVKIDLPVQQAKIENGYWQVFENTASYGLGSAALGEKGNMVIFAHARDGLFYNLKNVKENDLVFVYNKNKKYTYKVKYIKSVYPYQTEVIAPTKNETLTLYTCTGFYDDKRLIVVSEP